MEESSRDVETRTSKSENQPAGAARSRSPLARIVLWAAIAVVVVVLAIVGYRRVDQSSMQFDVIVSPQTIAADNTSSALLEIRITSRFGNRLNVRSLSGPPVVRITEGANLVTLIALSDSLTYRLRAGVETGHVVVHVIIPGAPGPIEATLDLMPSLADRNRNGYPDALDLTSTNDRSAFRRWFTTIALAQITHLDDRWHDRDCAGLLRYCYREALKKHDNRWLADRRWLVTAAIPDVRKYNYPNVPIVGTRVFNAGSRDRQETREAVARIPEGGSGESHRPARGDPGGPAATFHDFAEAARLKDNSLQFISRDPATALPGDAVFYLNDTDPDWPYHSMIYLGDGMMIYHTGPDGNKPGIVKRLSLAQLAQHPNPRWHPVASNPYFLGFYRWRILL